MDLQAENKIEYNQDNLPVCSNCKALLKPIYENNGYSPPEGPSMEEIRGYEKCKCLKKEK